jgi:hypothetical protein
MHRLVIGNPFIRVSCVRSKILSSCADLQYIIPHPNVTGIYTLTKRLGTRCLGASWITNGANTSGSIDAVIINSRRSGHNGPYPYFATFLRSASCSSILLGIGLIFDDSYSSSSLSPRSAEEKGGLLSWVRKDITRSSICSIASAELCSSDAG